MLGTRTSKITSTIIMFMVPALHSASGRGREGGDGSEKGSDDHGSEHFLQKAKEALIS
jgi:hypothetical protein